VAGIGEENDVARMLGGGCSRDGASHLIPRRRLGQVDIGLPEAYATGDVGHVACICLAGGQGTRPALVVRGIDRVQADADSHSLGGCHLDTLLSRP
jgi:hypothetical protein